MLRTSASVEPVGEELEREQLRVEQVSVSVEDWLISGFSLTGPKANSCIAIKV